ncbi:MAG: PQQ-binding-like beta-propeller repeat protein [Oscillospiraceae bacterium]|nr:PQQ-binding-like beta-propeller repeat protein [Oscillospiraceae bacterium]
MQHGFLLSLASTAAQMKPALIVVLLIMAAMVLSSVSFTIIYARTNKGGKVLLYTLYAVTVIVLICTVLCCTKYFSVLNAETPTPVQTEPTEQTTEAPEETTVPVETTEPTVPDPTYTPEMSETSDPSNWGISWEIIQNGSIIDSYNREEPISFDSGDTYTDMEGIITFRGDNYRSGATYGTANVVNETLTKLWSSNIGSFNGWPGSGWTGQPLIVRWSEDMKQIMNLYEDKKAKEDLVEVIYATLDGYIYFYDLEDGSYTRDRMWVGMNFKGAGALDPRGYPLMYVGSGDYVDGKSPRLYIISLIDTTVLYERSGADSFTLRSDWAAFDSSPLVDAETDTLIWPGESGILYTIKLNSNFDKNAGTITIAPEETIKSRYDTSRSGSTYWLGYEPSCVIVDRYLYISENGGMFFCIDLNTMELVWAQDTKDDSNSTPVFQWDESGETGYLYTAPSLHWTANSSSRGEMSIYKLDAKTGEIVWEYKYDCHTVSGVSGGVQSTPLLGKPGTDLEGLIIYSVARTPQAYNGQLIALNTSTGDVAWELPMDNYSWSSPAAVYTESGKAYIVICDSIGNMSLVNGSTGEVLSTVNLGSNVEASPAVFGDIIVVGTRGQKIYGIKVE